jgi:NADH:ubiquinone oxidoreductase subunit 4 (subunit M)
MILFLVASIFTLIFFNTKNVQQMRSFSLFSASITLILACLILDSFDPNIYNYQHKFTYTIGSEILNLSYTFGLDSLSIYFLVLSSFLVFLCILFI